MYKKRVTNVVKRNVGLLFTVGGLWYLYITLSGQWPVVQPLLKNPATLIWIFMGGILWAISVILLAYNWASIVVESKPLLNEAAFQKPSPRKLIQLYCSSNLAKYLPGNIMHLAARQIYAKAEGYTHKAIANASIAESVALILTATAFGVLMLWALGEWFALKTYYQSISVYSPVIIGLPFIGLAIGGYFLITRNNIITHLFYLTCRTSIFTSLFFALLAFNIASYTLYNGTPFINALLMAAAYIASWAIGYILPGVSAGIGVREAAFLAIIKYSNLFISVDESELLMIALSMRIINIIGDIWVFLFSIYLKNGISYTESPD